jgi:DNA-binding response OmpR family regulator
MIRVRVVDDRDVLLAGIRAVLDTSPNIEVIDAVDHDTALAPNIRWDGIDVAIVDAADDRKVDDQFPGVAVVERIRASSVDPQPNVIVVTGHAVHDGLRVRMREAGADWLLHRTDIGADLVTAVLTPRRDYGGVPDPADRATLQQLGWHDGARINDAVRWAIAQNQIDGLRSGTRRGLQAVRAQFTKLTRVEPRNNDGSSPDRRQNTVAARQANRLLRWATKIDNNDE